MQLALVIILIGCLLTAFIIFNLRKRVAVTDQNDQNDQKQSDQSESKFPIGVLVLLIILGAAFATYMAMPAIMGTN